MDGTSADEIFLKELKVDFMSKGDLPPLEYSLGQEVDFKFMNKMKRGIIEIRDFGGAIGLDYHSYDIFIEEENMLYKHIPEADIFEV